MSLITILTRVSPLFKTKVCPLRFGNAQLPDLIFVSKADQSRCILPARTPERSDILDGAQRTWRPQPAGSAAHPCRSVHARPGVRRREPMKKPTGFMSNSPHLLDALHKRCFGRRGFSSRPSGGMHKNCLGKVARRAAIFSDTMFEMILSGFSAQKKADRRM